jgi:hypothetical protein
VQAQARIEKLVEPRAALSGAVEKQKQKQNQEME